MEEEAKEKIALYQEKATERVADVNSKLNAIFGTSFPSPDVLVEDIVLHGYSYNSEHDYITIELWAIEEYGGISDAVIAHELGHRFRHLLGISEEGKSEECAAESFSYLLGFADQKIQQLELIQQGIEINRTTHLSMGDGTYLSEQVNTVVKPTGGDTHPSVEERIAILNLLKEMQVAPDTILSFDESCSIIDNESLMEAQSSLPRKGSEKSR